MPTCNWPLGNGQTLEFTVYDSNTGWNKVAGLYIFTYVSGGYWQPLYIGQAEDFSTRIPNHEQLEKAVQKGATHIHAAVVPLVANRDKWEKMLIQYHQPPMNVHHR